MSELSTSGPIEFDPLSYDLEVGVEAACAINGIATGLGLGYREMLAQHETGELDPTVSNVLGRIINTADRHLERSPEHDMFVAIKGIPFTESYPQTLELFSIAGAEAQLSDSEIERRRANRTNLENSFVELTEPILNAVADKLPVGSESHRPWKRRSKPVEWVTQTDTIEHTFRLEYQNGDKSSGPTPTEIRCENMSLNNIYLTTNGPTGWIYIANGRASAVRVRWPSLSSADANFTKQTLASLSPMLEEQALLYGPKRASGGGAIDIQMAGTPTLVISAYHTSNLLDVVSYIYDDTRDLFVDREGKRGHMSVAAATSIMEAALGLIPTVEVSP
jgi:hypothetical protein